MGGSKWSGRRNGAEGRAEEVVVSQKRRMAGEQVCLKNTVVCPQCRVGDIYDMGVLWGVSRSWKVAVYHAI